MLLVNVPRLTIPFLLRTAPLTVGIVRCGRSTGRSAGCSSPRRTPRSLARSCPWRASLFASQPHSDVSSATIAVAGWANCRQFEVLASCGKRTAFSKSIWADGVPRPTPILTPNASCAISSVDSLGRLHVESPHGRIPDSRSAPEWSVTWTASVTGRPPLEHGAA